MNFSITPMRIAINLCILPIQSGAAFFGCAIMYSQELLPPTMAAARPVAGRAENAATSELRRENKEPGELANLRHAGEGESLRAQHPLARLAYRGFPRRGCGNRTRLAR